MRWTRVPAFLLRWSYPAGKGPFDQRATLRLYGGPLRRDFWTSSESSGVRVSSTPSRRDGWSYNVVEMKSSPVWLAYFSHRNGMRLLHRRSPERGADALMRWFGVRGLE